VRRERWRDEPALRLRKTKTDPGERFAIDPAMAASRNKSEGKTGSLQLGVQRGRRAKIVCTLGPVTSTEAMLRELMQLGMDVARLNFSHGTHEEHGRLIQRLRRAADHERRTICILQDLQGPKIRTGRLKDRRPVMLETGSRVTITPRDIPGDSHTISTSYPSLGRDLDAGSRVLLADGLIELYVEKIVGKDIIAEVINGGLLGENKGINLPGTALSVPSLTPKDRKDLEFGIKHEVDAIALSFVRTATDVLEAKRIIDGRHADLPVIAKLEKPQAIENLEEILGVADGVMVARGDLGVEMPLEQVPVIQKHVIRRAFEWRKPVITATQMLESMIENPRPTRAEASDVANAVFDGTDAVMLSAETASGKYPREAVSMMAHIIAESEAHMREVVNPRRRERRRLSISESICESVAHTADELDMRAICVYTQSGTTARLVSKYRPTSPILGFANLKPIANRMNLYWGVDPAWCEHARTAEEMVRTAEKELVHRGMVASNDVIGIISGTRGDSGSTNLMRLHVIGELEQGRARSSQKSSKERGGSTGRRRVIKMKR